MSSRVIPRGDGLLHQEALHPSASCFLQGLADTIHAVLLLGQLGLLLLGPVLQVLLHVLTGLQREAQNSKIQKGILTTEVAGAKSDSYMV